MSITELWKDIDGYDGLYQVSSFGNVQRAGKQIRQNVNKRSGYHSVMLCKNGAAKRHYVHRLVAAAFVAHNVCGNHVNHIDEDKSNNRADNLEWCTQEYNNHYGEHAPAKAKAKGVVQCQEDGAAIAVYSSAEEASQSTGVLRQSIGKCCLGKRKRAGGYYWKFAVESGQHEEQK